MIKFAWIGLDTPKPMQAKHETSVKVQEPLLPVLSFYKVMPHRHQTVCR